MGIIYNLFMFKNLSLWQNGNEDNVRFIIYTHFKVAFKDDNNSNKLEHITIRGILTMLPAASASR